jgi:uncharacterized protein (TIGR02246 family)
MKQFRGTAATPAAALTLALFFSACAQIPTGGAPGSAFDREAKRVRAAVEALVDAANRGDIEGMIASYTEDVVLKPPTGATISGRAAVRAHYEALFESQRLALRVQFLETSVTRATATVRGRVTGRSTPLAGRAAATIDDDLVADLELEDDGRWRIGQLSWTPRRATTGEAPASPGSTRTGS